MMRNKLKPFRGFLAVLGQVSVAATLLVFTGCVSTNHAPHATARTPLPAQPQPLRQEQVASLEPGPKAIYQWFTNPDIRWSNKSRQATIPMDDFGGLRVITPNTFGTGQVLAVFDTGASTSFPRRLDVGDKPTGYFAQTFHLGLPPVPHETVVLPEVRFKDVMLNNVPASAIGKTTERVVPTPYGHYVISSRVPAATILPFIGSDTLFPFAYEIDVKQKVLTLKDPKQLPLEAALPAESAAFPLEFTGAITFRIESSLLQLGGKPVVRGEIAGVPVNFLIDTGVNRRLITVMPTFFKQLQQKTGKIPRRIYGPKGTNTSELLLRDCGWSFAVISSKRLTSNPRKQKYGGTCNIVTTPCWSDTSVKPITRTGEPVLALIGSELLQRYKVTIDSTHRRMLLTPHQVPVRK